MRPLSRLSWAPLAAAIVIGSTGAGRTEAAAEFPFNPYPSSLSGNYLAARHAEGVRDVENAVGYYRDALSADPDNAALLERTFTLLIANGDIDEAMELAQRLLKIDKTNRFAHLALGIEAHKKRRFKKAQAHFKSASQGPLAELTANLLTAWSLQGDGLTDNAIKFLDVLAEDDSNGLFAVFHSGLISGLAGRREEAVSRLAKAYADDPNALRIVDAYVRSLARAGDVEKARQVAANFDNVIPEHPLVQQTLQAIDAGRQPKALVTDAQSGAAEVLYWLGSAIGRDGFIELSAIYLQLSRYLDPKAELATIALATLYERLKRYDRAIETFLMIDDQSPLKRGAEIQVGLNYNAIDKPDEARAHLRALIEADPSDLDAIRALGNVLRRRKLFLEAADVYSRGIATIASPNRRHWALYYYRAICYEQSKLWAKAEADLKKALELSPDEPNALNYLGYSWIDMSMHLDKALQMIETAVEKRPNDGYIVDSLGWAFYRLGRYEDAVVKLERAVKLRPDDPIINDHLGDAYWMVGRKLEAQFQWSHARDLNPTPENLEKIKKKLVEGLKAGQPDSAVSQANEDTGG